jgi:hypothetical protein
MIQLVMGRVSRTPISEKNIVFSSRVKTNIALNLKRRWFKNVVLECPQQWIIYIRWRDAKRDVKSLNKRRKEIKAAQAREI